jgi:uncharacterized protein YgiM (DUF1202 family)
MTAKRLQLIVVVTLALTMGLWAFSPAVYAQTTGQDIVRVLEGNWQTLSTGQQHWYRFDYAGSNMPIRISLDVNPSAGATFQVWTAAQFSQLPANTGAIPVAVAAQDTGDPNHLAWEGSFVDAGPHYIVVQPTGTATTQYLLNIGGRGLSPTDPSVTDGGTLVEGAVNVNIRSGPSTAYSVLRTIPQGTQLTVLGQDASTTWLSVRLADGTEGWIARFLTDFGGTVATVATPALVQPPLSAPSSVTSDVIVVSGAANVNVRSGPSTFYSVLRTVPQNTQLTVLGQDATSTWLSVRLLDGTEGWIARYLTNYLGIAPTLATPILAQPPLAPPPTTGETIPDFGVAPVANLYVGPSLLYTVIRTVPQGSLITILGQDATGEWLSVRLADGTEGWMSRAVTDFTGTATILPTPTVSQPPLAPPSTVTTPVVTVNVPGLAGLPLEPAPVDNFPVETTLAANWRVLPQGQTQWYAFTHPGDDQPVQIWMNVEPDNAAGFRIFTESDAQAIMAGANPDDFVDIARGTNNPNEPADLFWRGAFSERGRFYVMITNSGTGDTSYSIYGVGPGLGS